MLWRSKRKLNVLDLTSSLAIYYQNKYPDWFFGMDHFKGQFKNYAVVASFDAHEGFVIHLENGFTSTHKGFILK